MLHFILLYPKYCKPKHCKRLQFLLEGKVLKKFPNIMKIESILQIQKLIQSKKKIAYSSSSVILRKKQKTILLLLLSKFSGNLNRDLFCLPFLKCEHKNQLHVLPTSGWYRTLEKATSYHATRCDVLAFLLHFGSWKAISQIKYQARQTLIYLISHYHTFHCCRTWKCFCMHVFPTLHHVPTAEIIYRKCKYNLPPHFYLTVHPLYTNLIKIHSFFSPNNFLNLFVSEEPTFLTRSHLFFVYYYILLDYSCTTSACRSLVMHRTFLMCKHALFWISSTIISA